MTSAGELVASNFEEWHARYHGLLLPIARKLCGSAGGIDPEDLVQETLLRFIEHFDARLGARDESRTRNWLVSVMSRHFVDLLRSTMGRKKAELDPTITRWTLAHQGGGTSTLDRITQERFEWALKKLPPQDRLIFLLRCQGLRNQDIASRLRVKPGAVSQRVFHARNKLSELLKPFVEEGNH